MDKSGINNDRYRGVSKKEMLSRLGTEIFLRTTQPISQAAARNLQHVVATLVAPELFAPAVDDKMTVRQDEGVARNLGRPFVSGVSGTTLEQVDA